MVVAGPDYLPLFFDSLIGDGCGQRIWSIVYRRSCFSSCRQHVHEFLNLQIFNGSIPHENDAESEMDLSRYIADCGSDLSRYTLMQYWLFGPVHSRPGVRGALSRACFCCKGFAANAAGYLGKVWVVQNVEKGASVAFVS